MSDEAAPELPAVHTQVHHGVLYATLARPQARNAIDREMVECFHDACRRVEEAAGSDEPIRALVLRGSGGTFCAGGDVAEMRAALSAEPGENDPLYQLNREFGRLLERLDVLPCPVLAAVEGVALGGGLGLACVADLALVLVDARLGVPEARLGLVPAQVAPFVLRRVGAARARGLAVAGRTLDGSEAVRIGLMDEVHADVESLEQGLGHLLSQILLCAPRAVASAKALMTTAADTSVESTLDEGARRFVEAARGPEARAGMGAFLDNELPPWAFRVEAGRATAGESGSEEAGSEEGAAGEGRAREARAEKDTAGPADTADAPSDAPSDPPGDSELIH